MTVLVINAPATRHQNGLSLIELMIAMALGLILTLGVVQIFLASSNTYRLNDGLGKVQENIRFSLGQLQYDARMAGYFGCLIEEPFNQLDESDDDYEEISYGGAALTGWDANGTGLGDEFEIVTLEADGGAWSNGSGEAIPDAIAGEMLPGTDFMVVNGGDTTGVVVDTVNGNTLNTVGNHGISAGSILLVVSGDCSGGDLFQSGNNPNASALVKSAGAGGNVPGNKNTSGFNGDFEDDATVYAYSSTAYFIGEGANEEPALFRQRLDAFDPDDPFPSVELAEGVENMQLLYGVADGVERIADRYVTAADVNDWGDVVSVRMALLFRSGDRVTDEDEARTVNLAGTEVTTQSDRRVRVVGFSTVGIRNRLK